MSSIAEAGLEELLHFLQQERGFDFTGYKRPSLMRRIRRRMQLARTAEYSEYIAHLEASPDEFELLFNTILINVTSFFRDLPAWEYLCREVLPPLVKRKGDHAPLRIWSAGCASGEEAYTVAIALAEALGDFAQFRERVKIYATDVDEEALAQARLATYPTKSLDGMEPGLRERYFDSLNGRYVFRGDLRRAVIFGRHDLLQDAPISRLDLLVCRNTLMYFNAETQSRIMARFHFALNGDPGGGGVLFLGRAEMLLSYASLFQPLDLKCRIFAKVPQALVRPRIAAASNAADANGADMIRNDRLRELALDDLPVARIVVDADGALVHANLRARTLFSIHHKDLGRPLQDLEISYRPLELRGLIEQAYAERRPVVRSGVERKFADGELQYLEVTAQPMLDEAFKTLGVAVSFVDVTRQHKLQDELQNAREEIQTAGEELQSSNEELETTNEELQSSNEELETTNEELQSTNEELETMNEELQSTNEELQTVNDQLRQRTEEMDHLNAFLQSVLGSLRSGAVVVNRNLDVLVWNHRAEDMWGLRADEVKGKSLLNLDIGLPVSELRDVIRPPLQGDSDYTEVTVNATNRRGKAIRCRITCTPLVPVAGSREGVIVTMDEVD